MSDDKSVKIEKPGTVHRQFGKEKILTPLKKTSKILIGTVCGISALVVFALDSKKEEPRPEDLSLPKISFDQVIDVLPFIESDDNSRSKKSSKKKSKRSGSRSRSQTKNTAVSSFEFNGPEIISRPLMDLIPPGSAIKAKLIFGASNGMVKAVSMGVIDGIGAMIPEGSVFIGQGQTRDFRLYINFTKLILPSGKVKQISAHALDRRDKITGLKGKKLGNYALRLAASSALNFLAGAGAALQERQVVQGVSQEMNTPRNAALLGTSRASIDLSNEILQGARDKKPVVQIRKGTEFYIMFSGD